MHKIRISFFFLLEDIQEAKQQKLTSQQIPVKNDLVLM